MPIIRTRDKTAKNVETGKTGENGEDGCNNVTFETESYQRKSYVTTNIQDFSV